MTYKDPREFDALLDFLAPDRENAGIRYGELHHRLTRYFQRQDNDSLSSADLADATLDRVATILYKRSFAVQPTNLDAFIFAVARNIKREDNRRAKTITVPVEVLDSIPAPNSTETSRAELAQEILDDVLNSLPLAERNMLFAYYSSTRREPKTWERRKRLAAELGLPLQHLRVYVRRIREKIRRKATARLEEKAYKLPRP